MHQFSLPATNQGLADFWDNDGNGFFDPLAGDYPIVENGGCEEMPGFPDQLIFWIFNDQGGGALHGETHGTPIRMEPRQHFATAEICLSQRANLQNGIGKLYQWEVIDNPSAALHPYDYDFTYIPKLIFDGADQGIPDSIVLTEDQFATGSDRRLLNHRKHNFLAIAYAYNEYQPFDLETFLGQKNHADRQAKHQNLHRHPAPGALRI